MLIQHLATQMRESAQTGFPIQFLNWHHRREVVRWTGTPPALAIAVADGDDDLLVEVAARSDLSSKTLAELGERHPSNLRLQEELVANPALHEDDMLAVLRRIGRQRVRGDALHRVAMRQDLTPDVIAWVTSFGDREANRLLCANTHLTEVEWQAIPPSAMVWGAIAANPTAPPELVRAAFGRGRYEAASLPQAPEDVVRGAAANAALPAAAAASNPVVPLDVLSNLRAHGSPMVRGSAFANPRTSAEECEAYLRTDRMLWDDPTLSGVVENRHLSADAERLLWVVKQAEEIGLPDAWIAGMTRIANHPGATLQTRRWARVQLRQRTAIARSAAARAARVGL